MIERGMGRQEDAAPLEWYPSFEPQMPQTVSPRSSYAGFNVTQEVNDASQVAPETPLERAQEYTQEEIQRRRFISRHEPLVPSNQLGDSLGWNPSSRDIVDTVVYVTITPALGSGTADVPFLLDSLPGIVGGVQYTGLSSTIQQLLRDVRTPRLALCSRFVSYAPSAATMTGNIFAQIVTAAGDTIPLGAYPAASSQNLSPASNIAPSALANLSGVQHLQTISSAIVGPVPVTFQLGFNFLAIHPHSLAKKFSDLAVNE